MFLYTGEGFVKKQLFQSGCRGLVCGEGGGVERKGPWRLCAMMYAA